MRKGDLTTTSLPAVLRSLAADHATGCLQVDNGDEARVYLRAGNVYAVVLPGRPPRLGATLVASGDLSPGDLAEATEAQRTELQGWRLGELLVHLGYVSQPVVEAVVGEHLREAAAELALWPSGRWKFRTAERTREDVAPPVPVDELLVEVDRRRAAFDALVPVICGPDAVPVLSAAGTAPETQQLDPAAWSLLCAVDGQRSLAALAAAGGLTLHQAGALLASLVEAGLVDVEPAAAEPVADPAANAVVEAPVDDGESWAEVHAFPDPAAAAAERPALTGPAGIAARLAHALQELEPTTVGMAPTLMPGEDDHRALDARVDEEVVDTSVERASESLAAALGPATGDLELFPVDGVPCHAAVIPLDAKQAERRARDAAELAERQAEVEAARVAEEARAAELHAEEEAEADRRAEQARRAEEQAAELAAAQAAEAAQAEEAAAAEAARELQRQSAAIQAEAFAELSAAATSAGPVLATQDEAPHVAPEPVERYVEPADPPTGPPRGADTAALLRELSSLGFDDEPAPAPVPQPRPTMVPTAVAGKKRKGLFGRG